MESGHPHLFDLKFYMLQIQDELALAAAPKAPEKVVWGIRAPPALFDRLIKERGALGFRYALKERSYPSHLLAENGAVRIIRPKIGFNPPIDARCWLEITPETIRFAYQTRSGFVWLRRLVDQFGEKKIVLSSVLEKPPSMRDMVSGLALLLDIAPSELKRIVAHNSESLLGELYET